MEEFFRTADAVIDDAFVDIFNLYGRNNVNSEQWNELVGANREGGLAQFPTFGLKIEY